MKRLLLFLASVFCAWLFTGCSEDSFSSDDDITYWKYTSYAMGYSVRFPIEWDKLHETDGFDVLALSPITGDEDLFQEDVGVIGLQLDEPCDLDDYHLRNVGALALSLYQFQVVDSFDTYIAGLQAKCLRFTYRAGATTFFCEEYEVLKDDRAYVVICTALPETFADAKEVFAEIGYSLRISYTYDPDTDSTDTPTGYSTIQSTKAMPASTVHGAALAACAAAALDAAKNPVTTVQQ